MSAPDRPGPTRNSKARLREGLVLLGSAVVVILGAAATRPTEPPPPQAAANSVPSELAPLPSGAPPRGLEDLPSDDERSAGCHFPDRGFGDYEAWVKLPLGRALIPTGHGVADDGSFRLLVHFHGAEPVRKQLAPDGNGLVIVGVDAGTGSHAYERAIEGPLAFDKLVATVEAAVARANGLPVTHARAIVLSSWSAGYGAVGPILAHPHPRVDAVVLLDSLYAGYANAKHTLVHGQVAPFVEQARAAIAGGPSFYLTHTEIATPGYASTGEVASFLLAELGATATHVDVDPIAREAFPLRRLFEAGRLAIRGYAGDGRDAHCAQLHLLPSILRDVVLPALR